MILSALLSLVILNKLSCGTRELSSFEESFEWNEKNKYYFPKVEIKMKEMLGRNCLKSYEISSSSSIIGTDSPSDVNNILVIQMPVTTEMISWWKNIKRPIQMRVEPRICNTSSYGRRPFFERKGCIDPAGYMSQSGPRCQTSYLKWICNHSKMDTNQIIPNGFILPESDHIKTFFPPRPFILITRSSFVSM